MSDMVAEPNKRIAVIRTSDRIQYKMCRRKWGWGSHLRSNLGSNRVASPLWLGSGVHFALEDYHGPNIYGHPADALKAYYIAFKRSGKSMPDNYSEDMELGIAMMRYYVMWLVGRDPLTTYIRDGVPQIEVPFKIEIPLDKALLEANGYDQCIYSGTIDRVIIDQFGQLWVDEYKTAKQFEVNHLQTDPQITTYHWAASILYPDMPVAGVVYQQHKKAVPNEPRILKNGNLSVAKNQGTTHRMYRAKVIEHYGSIEKAPSDVIACMNSLAVHEGPDNDGFIRRDWVERNAHQAQAETEKILMEAEEMVRQDLPLYPNPTRQCPYFCSFLSACVSMDDGGDWEQELADTTLVREPMYDGWRKHLPTPEELKEIIGV